MCLLTVHLLSAKIAQNHLAFFLLPVTYQFKYLKTTKKSQDHILKCSKLSQTRSQNMSWQFTSMMAWLATINRCRNSRYKQYLFVNLILSSDSLSSAHVVWALMSIDQGPGTSLLSLVEFNLSSCLTAAGQVSDSFQCHFPFRLPDRWQMRSYSKTTAITWVPESTLD